MNVLVTGINGFVGSHLAAELLRVPGIQLSGTVRHRNDIQQAVHLHPNVKIFQVEMTEPDQVRSVITAVSPKKIFPSAIPYKPPISSPFCVTSILCEYPNANNVV